MKDGDDGQTKNDDENIANLTFLMKNDDYLTLKESAFGAD